MRRNYPPAAGIQRGEVPTHRISIFYLVSGHALGRNYG